MIIIRKKIKDTKKWQIVDSMKNYMCLRPVTLTFTRKKFQWHNDAENLMLREQMKPLTIQIFYRNLVKCLSNFFFTYQYHKKMNKIMI